MACILFLSWVPSGLSLGDAVIWWLHGCHIFCLLIEQTVFFVLMDIFLKTLECEKGGAWKYFWVEEIGDKVGRSGWALGITGWAKRGQDSWGEMNCEWEWDALGPLALLPGCGRESQNILLQQLPWTHQLLPDECIRGRNYFFSISQEMCMFFQMLRKVSWETGKTVKSIISFLWESKLNHQWRDATTLKESADIKSKTRAGDSDPRSWRWRSEFWGVRTGAGRE